MSHVADYKKNRLVIVLIGLAGMTAYMLPYLREYYYDAYLEFFGITNTQFGILGSTYGSLAIVGYCLGGWVADKMSLKLIVPGSLIVSGALGFVFLLKPSFPIQVAIYAIWGITTILTFWTPLMKCLKALARPDEQGRSYGLFDITRGALNFGTGLMFVAIFTRIAAKIGDGLALASMFKIYSVWTVVVGVIIYFALKDRLPDFTKDVKEEDKNFWKNVGRVLKMPSTWLLAACMFITYSVIISYSYVIPYCTAVFGMSAGLAAIMGYLKNGARIVGCAIGGSMADKKGLSNVYLVDMILMVVGVLGLLLCPRSTSFIWLLVIAATIFSASMYSSQALHFAVMEEGKYPVETLGAAAFIITPIGYAGESVMPLFNGWCLDHFAGNSGYTVMFITYIVMLAIAVVCLLVFRRINKDRLQELKEIRKSRVNNKKEEAV